jgi:DNA end-binding protein Ku
MAPRPAWKGYLKLSLVTCAVEVSNATTSTEKVSFRVLNRATGNTVKRQYVDAVSGKEVDDAQEVKGYEVGKDEYLLIEDEEIEAVQIESSHTLSIDGFVSKDEIEQIYLDTPYYVTPSDKVSEEAFAVIREALEKKKMAGLARIVLYRRERPVVIEPLDKGLLLTTLRYESTVRRPESVFEDIRDIDTDPEIIDLATHIIDRKMNSFDPDTFEDRYEDALLDLIKAKKAGRKPPKAKAAAKPSNVVNLFDALKKSLADEGEGSKPTKSAKPRKSPASKSKGASSRRRKSA